MKVKQEHLVILKDAFANSFSEDQLAGHMAGYKAAGLTERRARFDAFWAVNRRSQECKDVVKAIYEYANDDHLYTALKQCL